MSTLKFNAKYIAYISRFISVDDTRLYLRGINFTQAPDNKGVIAVAIDGHRAGILHDPSGELDLDSDFLVSFEKTFIAACKKQGRIDGESTVVIDDDAATLYDKQGKKITVGLAEEIDATFPQWRRIIPQEQSLGGKPVKNVAFNPKYIMDFSPDGKSIVYMRYANSGDDPVVIGVREFPTFTGILMPCKADENLTKLPWFLEAK